MYLHMEKIQWEMLSPDEIQVRLKEVLGEENYNKVSSPSINWQTNNEDMAQYFDSVLNPIDAKMRSIYEESTLPIIESRLDEVGEKHKDIIKEGEIDGFKKCLEEYVHDRIVTISGNLGGAINCNMVGDQEGAIRWETAFLSRFQETGPQELKDVNGILDGVYARAGEEITPPPFAFDHADYTPPDNKRNYVDAIKIYDLLQSD